MIRRVLGPLLALAAFGLLFYASRYWVFRLWEGPLFDIAILRPQGGVLGRLLRGTEFTPFELVIWAIAAFAVLTILQWIYDRLPPSD